jgi:hypothetical protein
MNTSKPHSLRYLITLVIALSLLIPASSSTLAVSSAAQAKADSSTVIVSPGNPIEVAFAMWFSWGTAQDLFDAVQMALDDYGQIKGFDTLRNDYDAGCDPPSGASAATAITGNAQNVGVVGPFCSSSTEGALPVFETADFVMISPSSTRSDLADFGPNAFNRVITADPGSDAFIDAVNSLPSSQAWEADFAATYGRTPDMFAKFAYDAATLLLTRIDEVSTLDGGGNLVIDRTELRTAVRTTTNFPAVTGPVTLDAFGTRVDFFSQAVWNDEFTAPPLDDRWSWLDEDPTHWSLTSNPGFMQVITQSPGMNRLVQNTPPKDFVIRTRQLFTPVENIQFAGLTVFNDFENKLVFGRAYCDLGPPACVGNGIYFNHVEGGNPIGSNYATSISATGEAYLRLVRDGSTYTGYVSENGTEWTEIGTHAIGFTPTNIGFYVDGQSSTTATPADFDFFVIEYDKSQIFLPIMQKPNGP